MALPTSPIFCANAPELSVAFSRVVEAAAPSGRDRQNHGRVGGGEAMECRSGVVPRAKR
jgi:hypothetical protein